MRMLVIGCHVTKGDKKNIEKSLTGVLPDGAEIVFEFEGRDKFLHSGGIVDMKALNQFDFILHFCNVFNPIQCQEITSFAHKEGIVFIDVGRCTGVADYHLTLIRKTALTINRTEKRFANLESLIQVKEKCRY